MPWREFTQVDQRQEFVSLALKEGANVSQLCKQFGISRPTAYKWLERYRQGHSLTDRSRRPLHSPKQTSSDIEQAVLGVRDQHPAWGGRKLEARLQHLGQDHVPAPSTITEILRRHGRLDPAEARKHSPFVQFVRAQPNELWQMDFKGYFRLLDGTNCHPLTVLDDHSRYALTIRACRNERKESVQTELIEVFRRHGLPWNILVDNGPPWGTGDWQNSYTSLVVWLLRLGVWVIHSRPYHPQTQGKDERFHRTMVDELLRWRQFEDLVASQRGFDQLRHTYNFDRPHQALGMSVPAQHYVNSDRCYPEQLPPIDYPSYMQVRSVSDGAFSFKGREYRINKAFSGYRIGLHQSEQDGLFEVFFCSYRVAQINILVTEN